MDAGKTKATEGSPQKIMALNQATFAMQNLPKISALSFSLSLFSEEEKLHLPERRESHPGLYQTIESYLRKGQRSFPLNRAPTSPFQEAIGTGEVAEKPRAGVRELKRYNYGRLVIRSLPLPPHDSCFCFPAPARTAYYNAIRFPPAKRRFANSG